jgi:hypothetical protein
MECVEVMWMLSQAAPKCVRWSELSIVCSPPRFAGFFAAQFAALSALLDRLNTAFQRFKLLQRVYIAHATHIIHYLFNSTQRR